MEISKFKTSAKLESEGTWVTVGEDLQLLIARWGNPKAKAIYDRLTMAPEIKFAMRNDSVTEEMASKILIETLSEAILLDWKGLTDKGQEVPYSKPKARELLALADFRQIVQEFSRSQELFRENELAQAQDNLKKT